jgi:hypothetical protein
LLSNIYVKEFIDFWNGLILDILSNYLIMMLDYFFIVSISNICGEYVVGVFIYRVGFIMVKAIIKNGVNYWGLIFKYVFYCIFLRDTYS